MHALTLLTMSLPAAIPIAGPQETVETSQTVWEFLVSGGSIMIPLALCSIAVLALSMDRYLRLTTQRVVPRGIVFAHKGRPVDLQTIGGELDTRAVVTGRVSERGGTLVVSGFLNRTNDLVNSWDGTMVNRGNFFSHFMYNFGQFTNETTGTVEFELHLENNAPMTNHGHLYLVGNYINIPQRTLNNLGTLDIAPTGILTNSGRMVHAGELNNLGTLQNDAELIEHCDSLFSGNPIEGQGSTGAQSMSIRE